MVVSTNRYEQCDPNNPDWFSEIIEQEQEDYLSGPGEPNRSFITRKSPPTDSGVDHHSPGIATQMIEPKANYAHGPKNQVNSVRLKLHWPIQSSLFFRIFFLLLKGYNVDEADIVKFDGGTPSLSGWMLDRKFEQSSPNYFTSLLNSSAYISLLHTQ